MTFSTQNNDRGKFYNNADSFAMAFDEEWKRLGIKGCEKLDKTEKLNQVLENLKEHPFVDSSPEQAKKVCLFRIKLLNLS